MLAADVRVFFYLAPCDMRKQMDGLSILVREAMKREPENGELYLFRNRNRNFIKILFYDHGGYCLFAKRLSKGCFRIELASDGDEVQASLSSEELAQLLSSAQLVQKSERSS